MAAQAPAARAWLRWPAVAARRDAEILQQVVRVAVELADRHSDAPAHVIPERGTLEIVHPEDERDRSKTVATRHQQQRFTIS
jgi:hypothetical protein